MDASILTVILAMVFARNARIGFHLAGQTKTWFDYMDNAGITTTCKIRKSSPTAPSRV